MKKIHEHFCGLSLGENDIYFMNFQDEFYFYKFEFCLRCRLYIRIICILYNRVIKAPYAQYI